MFAGALTLGIIPASTSPAVSAPSAAPASTQTTKTAATLPANSVVFDSNRTGNYEIYAMDADGSNQVELTRDVTYDSWWPRISPDRTEILFYRTPKGTHDRDYTKTSLWIMNADGSDAHQVLATGAYGWGQEGHAVWSPDGSKIVLFAGTGPAPDQIWEVDPDGSDPVELTHRRSTSLDPSVDSSGRILFVSCPTSLCTPAAYQVFRMNADGSDQVQLSHDTARSQDPFSSPDGGQVAWLRTQTMNGVWAIYAMNADGSDPHAVVAGLAVNSKPAWSSDGQWIYFHRESPGQTSYGIWRVHPDGTDLEEIAGGPAAGPSRYANEYPDQSEY